VSHWGALERRTEAMPAKRSRRLLLLGVVAFVLVARAALAAPPSRAKAPERSWSSERPAIARDLAAGRPLVVRVLVPLCSNDQIDCGSRSAGQPGNSSKNLYWGAIFGARRFLERKGSRWERVDLTTGEGVELERAVYRRRVSRARWGLVGPGTIEQIVVLEAVHGSAIDRAVADFWELANDGGRVSFVDGGKTRTERVHAAGYAGHNRLMDGLELKARPRRERSNAVPSFVLACYSERYFGAALREAGSEPLVLTRALMAPEGYLLEAVLTGLGDNESRSALRRRAVDAYARWQRLSTGQAQAIFAR
jgi:hypothetical protein